MAFPASPRAVRETQIEIPTWNPFSYQLGPVCKARKLRHPSGSSKRNGNRNEQKRRARRVWAWAWGCRWWWSRGRILVWRSGIRGRWGGLRRRNRSSWWQRLVRGRRGRALGKWGLPRPSRRCRRGMRNRPSSRGEDWKKLQLRARFW